MVELGLFIASLAAVIQATASLVDAVARFRSQASPAAAEPQPAAQPAVTEAAPAAAIEPAVGPPILLGDSLSRRLRAARTGLGLAAGELARRSGLARHTVIRIERGEYEPRRGEILALAEALSVPPDALLPDGDVVRS